MCQLTILHVDQAFEVGVDDDGYIVSREVQRPKTMNAPEGIFSDIRNVGADLRKEKGNGIIIKDEFLFYLKWTKWSHYGHMVWNNAPIYIKNRLLELSAWKCLQNARHYHEVTQWKKNILIIFGHSTQ